MLNALYTIELSLDYFTSASRTDTLKHLSDLHEFRGLKQSSPSIREWHIHLY